MMLMSGAAWMDTHGAPQGGMPEVGYQVGRGGMNLSPPAGIESGLRSPIFFTYPCDFPVSESGQLHYSATSAHTDSVPSIIRSDPVPSTEHTGRGCDLTGVRA